MAGSRILLIIVAVTVVTASLASTAYAVCSTCGGVQDWSASATSFLEGKPINDTPTGLSNPQRIRQMNSDFNSNLLKDNTAKSANSQNNLVTPPTVNTPTVNISLKDINAMPNPVNSGSPVMITTSFGNNSSNSQSIPETNMTAYAIITNSAGVEEGKVNLERTSGEEYAGIWNANAEAGVYKATIVASASGASKTFNDVLQIDVSKAV
jgi:hypothetical protein